MENSSGSLERIEFWEKKFRESLDEQARLALESDPACDVAKIRDKYIISKLATLMVGCEELGARLRVLEGRSP